MDPYNLKHHLSPFEKVTKQQLKSELSNINSKSKLRSPAKGAIRKVRGVIYPRVSFTSMTVPKF